MTKVPVVSYERVIAALRRDGWVVVRQRGSHIRLQKHLPDELLKLIVPAHRPLSVRHSLTFSNRGVSPPKLS